MKCFLFFIFLFTSLLQANYFGETEDERLMKLVHKKIEKVVSLVQKGNLKELKKMTSKNKDSKDLFNATNSLGYNLLHIATAKGHLDVIEYLLKNGLKIESIGENKTQALHIAAGLKDPRTLNFLIKKGAKVNKAIDGDKKTPLHFVAELDYPKNAELLIKNGADVNAKDKWGETPLHKAISSKEVTETLIENGAKVDAKNPIGQTPLMLVLNSAEHDPLQKIFFASLLIKHGANILTKDHQGKTAYDLALDLRDPKINYFFTEVAKAKRKLKKINPKSAGPFNKKAKARR